MLLASWRTSRALSFDSFRVKSRSIRVPPRLIRSRPSNLPKAVSRPFKVFATVSVIAGFSYFSYENYQPFRHTVLAVVRCSRVAVAAVQGAVDYKLTFAKSFKSETAREAEVSQCHKRSAERVLKALLANGGIFIKLGQHMSSLFVLPKEWTSTMRPLQDRCEPTSYESLEGLFLSDMGAPIHEFFTNFDPNPIGVASLAQVHAATDRITGQRVAVKVQHPHLAEFCDVDMKMVQVTLNWIKYLFPEFEFTWLGEEMRENLPKEMDFVHEAANAVRVAEEFENVRSSLYVPKVLAAKKRVLVMEYIQGGRVDDLNYLVEGHIDRNKVALELSRIFSQMVFINGWFHADPHPGNLLIRPAPLESKSPYNFEIVLLDHGLYFDLDHDLRINYSKFWLSLIAHGSEAVYEDRRKYAQLVGNIGLELYPVFEAAITGRAGMQNTVSSESEGGELSIKRATGLMNISPQTEEEMEFIRSTVAEGLITSIFDVLRRVPRRVLMVLKLNDLTRNLDHALMTTHSNIRIFLVTAKYCFYAVWRDDQHRLITSMRDSGLLSFSLLREYFFCWWHFQKNYTYIVLLERIMDFQGYAIKSGAWFHGLFAGGLDSARKAAAGLD